MLQSNGFTEAIVIVPDSVKSEVTRIPERYGLSLRLDVVGISGQEDIGTADSLRLVADKLTGADVVLVSGDLVMEESLRGLVDLHRMKGAALTSLLARWVTSQIMLTNKFYKRFIVGVLHLRKQC